MRDIRELLRRGPAPDFHRVPAVPDPYNEQALNAELADKSYHVICVPMPQTVESTMKEIEKYVDMQPSTVILADHQTQGVGRADGKVWHDTPGCSILMTANFILEKKEHAAVYSSLVALKVCLALRKATGNNGFMIKYPNDIVHEDKKVAGIITPSLYANPFRYRGTLVGMGINVHYTEEELAEFPTDYGTTSLDVVAGTTIRRQDVVKAILVDIRDLAHDTAIAYTNPDFKGYGSRWKECSSLMGRQVVVTDATETIQGEVVDVNLEQELSISGRVKPIGVFSENMKVRIA